MNNPSACPTIRDGDDDVARQWVAGTLSPAMTRDFDVHLLTCDRCQLAVENAAVLAATMRESLQIKEQVRRRNVRRRWYAPLAIAAGLMTFFLWPRDPLRQLANPGAPPVFAPVTVRAEGEVNGAADRGMAAYQRGDYREAASRLGEAASAGNATSGVRFFLGVSALLAGDASRSIQSLLGVVVDDASPYWPEAHLWLAKAWLRAGAPDSATRVLEKLAERTDVPGLSAHARALADSIREVHLR